MIWENDIVITNVVGVYLGEMCYFYIYERNWFFSRQVKPYFHESEFFFLPLLIFLAFVTNIAQQWNIYTIHFAGCV